MRTTLKSLILVSLFLFTLLLAAGPAYAAALYFPHVDTTYGWQTEIALINASDQAVSGTLRGLSNAGQLVETKAVTLSARGRRQIIVADEFTNHTSVGYIVFDSNSDTFQGYTKYYKQGKYRVAIPAVTAANTSDIYITHIDSGSQWWTGLSLVNTTLAPKTITITFNTNETRTVTLNANEHKPFLISSLFNNQRTPLIKSAVISNASGVIGLEVFGTDDDKQLEGILLTDKTASTLYYPHVAGGAWWTGIVAYNPSESASTITITPYDSQGIALTTSTLSIPGKSKYVGFVTNLGLPAQTAWFRIDSSIPLSGFELIGTNDYELLAGYNGNGATGAKAGVFPKIEKNGGGTIIYLVNTEAVTATVTLTSYTDAGAVAATEVIPIGGHAKYSSNVAASSATYIAYSSDRNVVGFQLNGSSDGTMLDGLPGLGGGPSTEVAITLTDLVGTWNVNALASGPGEPFWYRARIEVNPVGSFSGTAEYYGGNPEMTAGVFSITTDGKITLTVNNIALCRMDAGKTVMACTETWGGDEAGTTNLIVLTKEAALYTLGDLTGTWHVNGLATGPSDPYWMRGSVVVNPDGTFSKSVIDSKGGTDNTGDTFSISAQGLITQQGKPNARGKVDAGKTVFVMTDRWVDGTAFLTVAVKKASSYSMADLAGTWEVNSLASGPGAPWWERAQGTISAGGSFSFAITDSDGNQYVNSGTFNISPEGLITIPGRTSLRCAMDSDKMVVVCTDTWDSGSPGTTEIKIFTKKLVR